MGWGKVGEIKNWFFAERLCDVTVVIRTVDKSKIMSQWAQVVKIHSHNIHTTLVLRYKYFNQMISFYYVGKRFFS